MAIVTLLITLNSNYPTPAPLYLLLKALHPIQPIPEASCSLSPANAPGPKKLPKSPNVWVSQEPLGRNDDKPPRGTELLSFGDGLGFRAKKLVLWV